MSTKIYVGNMSFSATEDDVRDLFSQFGTVQSVSVITDRDTYRSKGFGFVEMEDEDAAKTAISSLNGTDWLERNIVVNVARDKR